MKTKKIAVIFPFSLLVFQLFGATNSVRYSIPGVVELRVKGGTCSGSLVGDSPIRILTAEHCLANLEDGGAEMIDPLGTQNSGKLKWIKSSKVFVSKNAEYRSLVEKKYKLAFEIEELELVASIAGNKLRASQLASDGGFLGSLFSHSKQKLSEKEQEKLEQTLEDALRGLEARSLDLKSLETSMAGRFADHDIAVLVFPTSLGGNLSVEQRVKNREILPLARSSSRDKDIPVMIGGFGITSDETQRIVATKARAEQAPLVSHFTTNTLSKNTKRPSMYLLFGNTPRDLKKANIPSATKGVPLPGDSGSGVLSNEGILAVTSFITLYSSHVPPEPNWLNIVDDVDSPVERYEYFMAFFPSTTSDVAQSLFADVESSSGPLVYADQVAEYSKVFESDKQSLLETGKRPMLLDIFKAQEFGFTLK